MLGVTEALEDFDTQRTGTLIAAYVDDLSNWYVRRSRRRFWDGDPAALATLHECLYVVTLAARSARAVHHRAGLAGHVPVDLGRAARSRCTWPRWPRVDGTLVDDELSAAVALARRLVELGRAARADAKVRTRQPLRRALVPTSAWTRLGEELRSEVAEELNVGDAGVAGSAAGDLVDHAAKGNFRALGKRFGKQTPPVAAAIAAADATALAAALARRRPGHRRGRRRGRRGRCADEVIVSERPREGWSVVNEQGETVALDLELTPELVRAGLAREVVRLVQEARKSSGFEVSRPDHAGRGRPTASSPRPSREHARADGRRGAGHRDPRGRPDGDVRRDDDLGPAVQRDPRPEPSRARSSSRPRCPDVPRPRPWSAALVRGADQPLPGRCRPRALRAC